MNNRELTDWKGRTEDSINKRMWGIATRQASQSQKWAVVRWRTRGRRRTWGELGAKLRVDESEWENEVLGCHIHGNCFFKEGLLVQMCSKAIYNRLDTNKWVVEVPRRVSINTQLTLRISIPHKLKSVSATILDIIIFITHVLQHLKVMQATAGIDCGDRAMLLAHLEPRSTW
jgi:hypothetical protein